QVTGAGGDGQEHLAGFHAVAVLGVPLDLELLGADDGEDRLGDAQSRDHARLAGGEVGGGDGVLGDGGDGGDVLAVGQVLLDGHVGDVLDLHGVQARVGQQLGEGGVEAALEVGLLVGPAAAAVAAATGGDEGEVGGGHGVHCSWVAWRVGGKSVPSVVRVASVRSGSSRTTMWRRQAVSSRSG